MAYVHVKYMSYMTAEYRQVILDHQVI